MATTAPPQLDPTSVDTAGLSVATAARSINPRTGTIYDTVTLAAAAPIWFHPLATGMHLMINSQIWTAATPVGGTPGAYSAYTPVTTPTWVIVNGLTGSRSAVPGQPLTVPMRTSVSSATLTAACSRPPEYLFLLNSVVISGQPQAVLQHIYISPTGSVALQGEEVLPTVPGVGGPSDLVVFSQGLQYATPNLNVYGTDSAGRVYRITKSWGLVGTKTWSYYTGSGLSADPLNLRPIPGLHTSGPMSFASTRNISLLTTVASSSGAYSAQPYTSTAGRPWVPLGAPIPLGSTDYLGGGLQLQPQLAPNTSLATMTPSVTAGIPYVVTTTSVVDGNSTLRNTWDLLTLTM